MPGGFGTLDELFEIATLVQTGKMKGFPIVLAGTEYWGPLVNYLRDTLATEGTISSLDVDRFIISDDPEAIASTIAEAATKHFGLTQGIWKPRWWLFERSPWKKSQRAAS